MSVERTFSIIKPDAVAAGHAAGILAIIEAAGFKVQALRMTRLSEAQARGFYAVHREKPFFAGLVKFMTEGRSSSWLWSAKTPSRNCAS